MLPYLKVLSAVSIFYTAYFGKSVFLPICISFFLFILLNPLISFLKRHGAPRMLSSVLIILFSTAALSGLGTVILSPAGKWVEKAPKIIENFKEKTVLFHEPLQTLSKAANRIDQLASGEGDSENKTQFSIKSSSSTFQMGKQFLILTSELASISFTIMLLLFFLLVFGNETLERVSEQSGNFNLQKPFNEIQDKFSKYISTYLLINSGLGAAVTLGLWLVNVPNPILWGFMAALLNFIPYFGPIVGCSIVFMVSMFSMDSFAQAVIAPLVYFAINSIEGQFVTPMLLGNTLKLNPLAVIFALILVGWMWGPVGALMSVPILMVLKVALDHSDTVPALKAFISE